MTEPSKIDCGAIRAEPMPVPLHPTPNLTARAAGYEAGKRQAFEETAQVLDTEETEWAEEETLCDNAVDRLSCTAKETECHRLAILIRALAKVKEQADE